MRRIWWGFFGTVFGLLTVGLAAQPFSAQIQQALRAFVAGNQTITGNWTCSGTCTGFGGGGTPASPSTSIQFNNSGSFGGSANLTWDGTSLTVGTGNLLVNGFGGVARMDASYVAGTVTTGTVTDPAAQQLIGVDAAAVFTPNADATYGPNVYGMHVIATADDSGTRQMDGPAVNGINLTVLSKAVDGYEASGVAGIVQNAGDGALSRLRGVYVTVDHSGTGTVTEAQSAYSVLSKGSSAGTITNAYGAYYQITNAGAASGITNAFGYYFAAVGGKSTNPYSFWSDEQGVYRIRSDNTFNSVYQGIAALYNPQFTKYTAGAANFERCIPGCQWESNVAVITTEVGAGGGNVLRDLKLGDAGAASVELGRNTFLDNGLALRGDTTAAHTWLVQGYDTDTGPAYVTFATITNGTAPSFALAPPAGGATVSVTASALATAGTTAVAVANVGPSSCGTTAATIAGNDTIGEIVVGATAGTQCRVTFTVAATVKRDCVVTDGTTTIATRATYVDSTHTDFLGAFVAGDTLNYVCIAR